MATNTYAMVGNGGRQGAGFQSGPHAGVAPGNDAYAGGAYVPASTPTGASAGGFAQRVAVGGPPPRFGVPEVNFAQPEKRSNARVPYARVVMMHGKNDTRSDELRLEVAKRGREYEYEGLHTGELAWTLTLHGLRAPGMPLGGGLAKRNDTDSTKKFVYMGAEQLFSIAEDTAATPGKVSKDATAMDLDPNKSVSDLVRSSDRLPQPFAGNQQNRATRLASTGWVEAVFAQGLRHVTIDLNATTLTGNNDERVALHADIARWANEGARPFGTAAFAERNTGALGQFDLVRLRALLQLAQTIGTGDAANWAVQVGVTAPFSDKGKVIDALAKAPATHSCIANYTVLSAPDLAYSMQKTRDGQDLQVGHPMRQGLFLLEDGPFLRTIGSEHGRQVTVELFDKQNEGEEPRERSRFEQVPRHLGSSLAQSAMCAELAAKGLLSWRPDGVCLGKYGEDSQQLIDNAEFDAQQGMLFNVGVQGPCITTSWTNGGEMACNPTDEVYVLLKCTAFYELSATTGSSEASFETVCALSDANTAAQRFAAAARPKDAPTKTAPSGVDINKLLAGIASGVPIAANESSVDERTARALSAACFDALWATERGRVLAKERQDTATWRATFGATAGLYNDAFNAVQNAANDPAAASDAVRAAREKLRGGGFRAPMKDGTWANWQMQYKSGAASAKAFVTDFELVRTTSSFLFARSHFDPNDAKSRCGLRSGLVEESGTKATGFSEFFVGGWKVGKVQDAAAARAAATPAIAGASPRNPAMKIDVDVQWLDADALHARFMDRDANASVGRIGGSGTTVTRTFESTTCSRPEATARSTSDQATVGKAVALREFARNYEPAQLSTADLNMTTGWPAKQNEAAVALREVGAHAVGSAAGPRLVSFAGSGRAAGWGPNADARGAYAWTDPEGEPLIRALDADSTYEEQQLQPDPHGRRAAVVLLGARKAGIVEGTLLESGDCPYFASGVLQRKNNGIVAKTAKHYGIKSWGAAGDDAPSAQQSIVPPPLVSGPGGGTTAVATATATAVA